MSRRNQINLENNPNYDIRVLHRALEINDIAVVMHLVAIPAVKKIVHMNGNFLLYWSIAHGHIELLKLLLQIDRVKAIADMNDNKAFYSAILAGRGDMALLLLEIDVVKANAHVCGNKILRISAFRGFKNVVRHLMQIDTVRTMAINSKDEPLLAAIRKCGVEMTSVPPKEILNQFRRLPTLNPRSTIGRSPRISDREIRSLKF